MLVLPDSERFVDATVEQFDEVREVGAGPMIGKVAMSTNDDSPMVEPGGQVMLQRGDLVLTYTIAGPDAVASVVEHPESVAHTDGHHRTGVNVASFTLVVLRGEGVRGRAMQAPHPRLRALLRAVGDAPYEADEAGDVRFRLARARAAAGGWTWPRRRPAAGAKPARCSSPADPSRSPAGPADGSDGRAPLEPRRVPSWTDPDGARTASLCALSGRPARP
ncbi:hypothetical protein [Streptomyces sp. NPDC003247]|uniref:hypothetical protein n=1 Tax=Streptomyces sp. NPDC003247 TaxID=3364677 RepID=UPI00369D9EB6